MSEGGGEGLGAGEVGSAEEANLYDDENDAAMDIGLATAEKGLPSSTDGLPFTQTQKQPSKPTEAKEARETSPAGDTDTVSPPTSTLSLWKGHLGSLLASIVACLIEAGRLEASTSFWIWDSSQVDTLLSTLQLERPHGTLFPLLPLSITSLLVSHLNLANAHRAVIECSLDNNDMAQVALGDDGLFYFFPRSSAPAFSGLAYGLKAGIPVNICPIKALPLILNLPVKGPTSCLPALFIAAVTDKLAAGQGRQRCHGIIDQVTKHNRANKYHYHLVSHTGHAPAKTFFIDHDVYKVGDTISFLPLCTVEGYPRVSPSTVKKDCSFEASVLPFTTKLLKGAKIIISKDFSAMLASLGTGKLFGAASEDLPFLVNRDLPGGKILADFSLAELCDFLVVKYQKASEKCPLADAQAMRALTSLAMDNRLGVLLYGAALTHDWAASQLEHTKFSEAPVFISHETHEANSKYNFYFSNPVAMSHILSTKRRHSFFVFERPIFFGQWDTFSNQALFHKSHAKRLYLANLNTPWLGLKTLGAALALKPLTIVSAEDRDDFSEDEALQLADFSIVVCKQDFDERNLGCVDAFKKKVVEHNSISSRLINELPKEYRGYTTRLLSEAERSLILSTGSWFVGNSGLLFPSDGERDSGSSLLHFNALADASLVDDLLAALRPAVGSLLPRAGGWFVCEGINHATLVQGITAFQKGIANVVDATYTGTDLYIHDPSWRQGLQNAINRPSGDLLFIQGPTDVTHPDVLHSIMKAVGIDQVTANAAKWVTLANGTKCLCVTLHDKINIEERDLSDFQRLIPGYAIINLCRNLAFTSVSSNVFSLEDSDTGGELAELLTWKVSRLGLQKKTPSLSQHYDCGMEAFQKAISPITTPAANAAGLLTAAPNNGSHLLLKRKETSALTASPTKTQRQTAALFPARQKGQQALNFSGPGSRSSSGSLR